MHCRLVAYYMMIYWSLCPGICEGRPASSLEIELSCSRKVHCSSCGLFPGARCSCTRSKMVGLVKAINLTSRLSTGSARLRAWGAGRPTIKIGRSSYITLLLTGGITWSASSTMISIEGWGRWGIIRASRETPTLSVPRRCGRDLDVVVHGPRELPRGVRG